MVDYYEAVRAYPDGESTAARLALTAAEYDFDGIVVRNAPETGMFDESDRDGPNREEIAAEYGVDVVDAIEIGGEDASAASARVKGCRDERTLVLVDGSRALNRFACEEPRVDVLASPMADGDVNHVLARAAARNGVRFEFDFSGTPAERRSTSPGARRPPEASRNRHPVRRALRGERHSRKSPPGPRAARTPRSRRNDRVRPRTRRKRSCGVGPTRRAEP